MKHGIAIVVCVLIVGASLRWVAPTWNQALAQEGTSFITSISAPKKDQPKSLDDVRKLQQASSPVETSGNATPLQPGYFVPLVTGYRLAQTSDPFETQGVLDPLPTLDTAKANVIRLREMLNSADEASRKKAQERAEDILTTYFLADMKARIEELDAIKKRVAEMEAQLEKRLQAQREIVDLQKKVMQSDANGLEFFGPAGTAGGVGGGAAFGGAGGFGGGISGGFGRRANASGKEATSDVVPAKKQSKTPSGL